MYRFTQHLRRSWMLLSSLRCGYDVINVGKIVVMLRFWHELHLKIWNIVVNSVMICQVTILQSAFYLDFVIKITFPVWFYNLLRSPMRIKKGLKVNRPWSRSSLNLLSGKIFVPRCKNRIWVRICRLYMAPYLVKS